MNEEPEIMDTHMPVLSIVMPVYNTSAEYLEGAIDSVLKQTFKDFELIIVDDCSDKVDAAKIVESFADTRIRLFRNSQNSGPGKSRNFGIDQARGEYLGFMDSDDFIEPDMYEVLLGKAREHDSDVTSCDCCFCDEKGHTLATGDDPEERVCRTRLEKLGSLKNGAIWNRVYKSHLFKTVRFPEKVLYEDNLFMIEICEFSKLMVTIPDSFYHYRMVSSSVTHNRDKEKQRMLGKKQAVLDIYAFMTERGFNAQEQMLVLNFLRKIFVLTSMDEEVCSAFRQVCKDKKLVRTLFKDLSLRYRIEETVKAYLFFPIYIRRIYQQNKKILKLLE